MPEEGRFALWPSNAHGDAQLIARLGCEREQNCHGFVKCAIEVVAVSFPAAACLDFNAVLENNSPWNDGLLPSAALGQDNCCLIAKWFR
jgi:hypothetical protein